MSLREKTIIPELSLASNVFNIFVVCDEGKLLLYSDGLFVSAGVSFAELVNVSVVVESCDFSSML